MLKCAPDRGIYLADDHKNSEEEDEGGFGDRKPLGLLKGEEHCSIQTGFGWTARQASLH